ncbi:hypothetical protein [Paenibacillus agricola]|uniref:Uncharacterized protein n=1 Tax=Paenibacillus agricola TaxID=2716264 RepID=A0ABX0JA75_9BACL|nr:hypothetical protein [Paenibacillus agricola]NHN33350.1 hypothetical protein [Paenibacillus agricola]
MNIVFRLIVTFIVFVIFLRANTFDRIMITGELRAYSATINGCHDAAIPKEYDMAHGWVVFDETKGLLNFRHSLTQTLLLNTDLSPKANSIFASPVKIIGLFFIGDDKVPTDGSGNPIYPYDFQENVSYRGSTIVVKETLYGPSVLGLIEVAYKVEGEPVTLKKAVYRYKDKSI